MHPAPGVPERAAWPFVYAQSLGDLEDYYERTVQLRRIQADTAIEERGGAKRSAAKKVAAMTAALT